MREIREKEENAERIRNMRYFDTTTATTFVEQDITANPVGKRVMCTQDGKGVTNDRDEQLQVEHGFGERTQKASDKELIRQIPEGDYTQTQPITLYTDAI